MNTKINPVLYIAIAIIVLVGLFLIMRPKEQTDTTKINPNIDQVTNHSPQASPESNIKNFELVIKSKKLTSGPETLKVTEGDDVTITITSDEEDEFHLHGYDKSVDLEKDTPAQLSFTTNLTGRFVYELENSKVDMGALEVSPK